MTDTLAKADPRLLRVDQIGSLAAPPALLDVLQRQAAGDISDNDVRRVVEASIRAVLRRQEEIGLPVLTDGEFARRNFQDNFAYAVSGYVQPGDLSRTYMERIREVNDRPLERAEQNFSAEGPPVITRRGVHERLRLIRNVALDEFRFAQPLTPLPVKATILSPDRIVQRFDYEASRAVYVDEDAFLADVIAIERQMIAELVEAGCRYIQIDAPGYTAYVDGVSLERMRARGEDPQRNLERSLQAENALIEGFDGVTFGIHVCRGNARTVDPATGKLMPQWHREGSYDAIAEQVFGTLSHDRLLLEYDSERAGGFEPLRYVRHEAVAVLGLVTTKSAELESEDELTQRIEDAARFVPVERLALSPQCGFGGSTHMPALHEETQWRKFDRILKTARRVWG